MNEEMQLAHDKIICVIIGLVYFISSIEFHISNLITDNSCIMIGYLF